MTNTASCSGVVERNVNRDTTGTITNGAATRRARTQTGEIIQAAAILGAVSSARFIREIFLDLR
jgi:hypothetical protein